MYTEGNWTHRPDYITMTGHYGNRTSLLVSEPVDSGDAHWQAQSILARLGIDNDDTFTATIPVAVPPRYRYAFGDPNAGVMLALGSARQGWMLQLSGAYWGTTPPSPGLLQSWLDMGLKCTRFDYAATCAVTSDLLSVAEYFSDQAKRAQMAYGKREPVWHKPHCAPGLQTHYAGSRKSAQFLRVYDKLDPSGMVGKLIRVEMEYKKEHAPRALQGYIQHGRGDVRGILDFMFADAVDFLPDELADLYDNTEQASIGPRIPPPPSNRAAWFYGNVEQAFKKWAAEDNPAAMTWLLLMERQYIEGAR